MDALAEHRQLNEKKNEKRKATADRYLSSPPLSSPSAPAPSGYSLCPSMSMSVQTSIGFLYLALSCSMPISDACQPRPRT